MPAEITVPALGESIVEATVGRWLKKEGESIAEGEPVVELETDKVNVEVPSTVDGTLQSVVKPEGETVAVGDVLALVEADGAAGNEVTATPPATAPKAATPSTREESMPASHNEGATSESEARSTPLARRIAAEHGIELNQVRGTGPSGRVTREDVESFLSRQQSQQPAGERMPVGTTTKEEDHAGSPLPVPSPTGTGTLAPAATPAQPGKLDILPAPFPSDAVSGRYEERVRMSRRRQTIAQRLVEAQHNAAMLTTFNEVDMTKIMELRKRKRDAFKERHGVNLGFMSFFTRAVVGALRAFPRLNAEIQGTDMILKHYYDIGIAVGAEEGLVVPVVRDADRLSFAEIERQIAMLAEKARKNELSLAELQGGTFTITNGGTFGSLLSTPILNAPQVGILGMHNIQQRPVAVDGEVVVRPMMYLALSYDHRIVDGREAVQALVRIKELIEEPETLLLEG
ncbi:MAG: 2-oxoglutarate dehydrogenase complex dihydrolipoyllysine-residue succinyltransferase [Chloroflexota bacterium]|nr:2-oxoglutarate dehydrogenase complex dihydrolipoyllysine-residue succinyltransferase [Chloroflexota bacterium]